MDNKYKEVARKTTNEKINSIMVSQVLGFFITSTFTAPLAVIGASMQLSVAANKGFYGEESKQITKLMLAKSYELQVKERKFYEIQLSSGMVGENRPFKAPIYNNYREVITALAGQGYQGFFKGNGIEFIFNTATLIMKTQVNY